MEAEIDHQTLLATGINLRQQGAITTITIPSHGLGTLLITNLAVMVFILLFSLGMGFLMSLPTTQSLVLGGLLAVVVVGVITFKSDLWVRAFEIRVDHEHRRVQLPRYQDAVLGTRSLSFGFDAVRRLAVDWNRAHLQRASKDAPIVSLTIVLGEDRPDAVPDQAFLYLQGLDKQQAKAFVTWFWQQVCPATPLPQLDPD